MDRTPFATVMVMCSPVTSPKMSAPVVAAAGADAAGAAVTDEPGTADAPAAPLGAADPDAVGVVAPRRVPST